MPINEFGMNLDYVTYFSLEEYVSRIKLLPYVLEHLENTSKSFDTYCRALNKYDDNYIINYWIYSLYDELISNQQIENREFSFATLEDKSILFDTLTISHKRIHNLHNFVTEGELDPAFSYRDGDVRVSRTNPDGTEDIFWRGANHEDIYKFMNDFIKVYKNSGTSIIYSNPFITSALMHLLFVRVHPYFDGNGRTSRIIHNMKFTEMINKLYGTRLKLSPLNLSHSILVNKITYAKRINNIYFDLIHDTNKSINEWFDFMLYMADEQINFSMDKLEYADGNMIKVPDSQGMRLFKFRKQ